mmetsp:Transcript_26538/g.39257  ORF Transcript_26538/g.39257 Transcript_26538/m.39257 type:complete len:527 (+) Transcript_26538:94-1674(+)
MMMRSSHVVVSIVVLRVTSGFVTTIRNPHRRLFFTWSSSSSSSSFTTTQQESLSAHKQQQNFQTNVPLIFIHGMKGSHLSDRSTNEKVWLSLSGLFNLPPKPDEHTDRDLSLPLTYDSDGTKQDLGNLQVNGLVNHIVSLGLGDEYSSTYSSYLPKMEFLPFYGHVSQHLEQLQTDGIRPTRCFVYDWRRSLPEVSKDFYDFCENEFPNTPVQVLAHSMGGLVTFDQMRQHPEKFAPGAVLVGVPFGTGIQYFQDLHRGYYTELGRCRQFTPASQFALSSHWSFFNTSEKGDDTFVDVSEYPENNVKFQPDVSAIGKPGTTFQETVPGKVIPFDFYDVNDWERNQVGIFCPSSSIDSSTMELYKKHMKIQLAIAKEWRQTTFRRGTKQCQEDMPPLVVCQTNTVPTLNQILRRRRQQRNEDTTTTTTRNYHDQQQQQWEYDYTSGRSVPGDGRIDFNKSFPPQGFSYETICLESLHAKQMCWEEEDGSLGTIMNQVTKQIQEHTASNNEVEKSLAKSLSSSSSSRS